MLVELDLLVSTSTAVGLLVLLVDTAHGGAEETVGNTEHIGLVADGDSGNVRGLRRLAKLLASKRHLEGLLADASRSFLGDLSDSAGDLSIWTGFARLRFDVLLPSHKRTRSDNTAETHREKVGGQHPIAGSRSDVLVPIPSEQIRIKTYQAFRVFTNDDAVNELFIVLGTPDANNGSNVGIQIQLLPQLDDGRAVTLNLVRRAGDGSEHGTVTVILESLDRLLW